MTSPLQAYDVLMLVVLVGCTVFGAWKGMAWQLASLASLIVSTMVAAHFSQPLAPYFSQQEPWNRFLAMLVLYLVTSAAIWLLFRLVAGLIDKVHMKDYDRQLGGLFGAAKGVLFCLVITFFAVTLSEAARQTVLRSHSGYYAAVVLRYAAPFVPQDVRAVLGQYIDELERRLDPQTPAQPPPADAPRGARSTAAAFGGADATTATIALGRSP